MLDFLLQTFDWSLFHVFLTLKLSMLKTISYLSAFKKFKTNYSFGSVLVGVIFSQVRPGIPQRVVELISWCQIRF